MIWSVESTSSLFHDYVALRGVRSENVALRQHNASLLAQVQALTETRAENERLRALPIPEGQHPFLDEILPVLEAAELLLCALAAEE